MKSYRKKPVIIQAVEFDPENVPERFHVERAFKNEWYLITPEQEYRIHPGDWIAVGTKGEVYPIPSEVFPTIYDEVV